MAVTVPCMPGLFNGRAGEPSTASSCWTQLAPITANIPSILQGSFPVRHGANANPEQARAVLPALVSVCQWGWGEQAGAHLKVPFSSSRYTPTRDCCVGGSTAPLKEYVMLSGSAAAPCAHMASGGGTRNPPSHS